MKKSLEIPNRDKRMEVLLKSARSTFGADSIRKLSKDEIILWPFLSTGLFSVDNILGIGGLPKGRSTEVFGPEGSGKTTFCLHAVSEAQKKGGIAVYIDAEHALDLNYAAQIGVDTDSMLFAQPDSAEQSLDMVEMMAERLTPEDIIVVDSVAALVPQEELDASTEKWQMGLQARLMGKGIRKCTGIIAKSGVVTIWVNQLRAKFGSYGAVETTPGGNALKFAASVRLDIRRAGKLVNSQGVEYGAKISIKTLKNKMACPFKKVIVDMIYGEGFSRELSLINAAVDLEIVEKSGKWYSFEGEKGDGIESFRLLMKGNEEIYQKVLESVKICMKSSKKIIEVEVVEVDSTKSLKEGDVLCDS